MSDKNKFEQIYSELSELVDEFKNFEEVECIYLLPHNHDGVDRFHFVIVTNANEINKQILDRINSINEQTKILVMDYDYSRRYSNDLLLDFDQLQRTLFLRKSVILYDKDNKYHSIVTGTKTYENVAESLNNKIHGAKAV